MVNQANRKNDAGMSRFVPRANHISFAKKAEPKLRRSHHGAPEEDDVIENIDNDMLALNSDFVMEVLKHI